MKITILNGNPEVKNKFFEKYLVELEYLLTSGNHQVTLLSLRDLNIHNCTGCFGCWVKTPGHCVTADDSTLVCQAMINSDFTLWASPIIMGFPSALLKKTMDKCIPLIHPYFAVDHGEAHHRPRYKRYPRLGLLLEKEKDTDAEDIHIITDIFSRTALNMKSRLIFSALINQSIEQTANAITSEVTPGELFDPQPKFSTGRQITPPKRLTVFNGSPRGTHGNTPFLLEQFLKGFSSVPDHDFEIIHLTQLRDAESIVDIFTRAECILFGFPLYTDAMPGMVKSFIEHLEPIKYRVANPPIGFFVHSGFPEALHSRHIQIYVEKLATRLGTPYLGTIVKGGSEGIRTFPETYTKKMFEMFFHIGKIFGENGKFDPQLLFKLAKPERYPAIFVPLFKILSCTPLTSLYWDNQLKKNGVFEQRYAKPFVE